MSMQSAVSAPSSKMNIVIWVLRVLMAALFLFAAFGKLSGMAMMVQEFDTVGLGQWFRYFTGVVELAGALALLIPAASGFGAILLLLVDIGAFIAQVAVIHMDWIHTIVIGAILAALVYLQRSSIQNRLGL